MIKSTEYAPIFEALVVYLSAHVASLRLMELDKMAENQRTLHLKNCELIEKTIAFFNSEDFKGYANRLGKLEYQVKTMQEKELTEWRKLEQATEKLQAYESGVKSFAQALDTLQKLGS